jgi:hypothetical protein
MTPTVEINEDTYRRLETLAQLRGTSVEDFVEQLVRQQGILSEPAVIDQLQAAGFFINEPPPQDEIPVRDFQPVDLQPGGKPVSQILIEERR